MFGSKKKKMEIKPATQNDVTEKNKPKENADTPDKADDAAPPLKPFSRNGTHMPSNTSTPGTFRAEIPRRVVDIPGRNNDHPADEGRRLTVGREIQLTGEITSCDKLVVEGQVEANLAKAGSIDVSKDGIFKGTAEVKNAEISGLFEGTLTVHEKLRVTPTGRIIGNVNYKAIIVEAGGKVNGKIETIEE